MGVFRNKYNFGKKKATKAMRRIQGVAGQQELVMKTTSKKRIRQLEKDARRKIKEALKQELAEQGSNPEQKIEGELADQVAQRVRLAVDTHVISMALKRHRQASRGAKITEKNVIPLTYQDTVHKVLEREAELLGPQEDEEDNDANDDQM